MKNPISGFAIRLALISVPMLLLTASYLYFDPYKVLRPYSAYFESGKPNYVVLNKGYVSLQTFIHNYPVLKYDSIVFGSSRSMYYRVADWKTHIKAVEGYHFDAAGESLFGIYKKFEFLHANNVPLRNALIILDTDTLSKTGNSKDHLFQQPPQLTQKPMYLFHLDAFKTFLNPEFLTAYFDLKLFGQMRPYMKDAGIMDDRSFEYDPASNEILFSDYEAEIKEDRGAFYASRKNFFRERSKIQQVSPPVIQAEQRRQLQYIKDRLAADQASYRLVISPGYDQVKFNPGDLEILNTIFGSANVFDFSGINEFTTPMDNFYDGLHYRPHVAKQILDRIYR